MSSSPTMRPRVCALFSEREKEDAVGHALPDFMADLSQSEIELFSELLRARRTIRYGSVNLTFHDGRNVDIHETERIRSSARGRHG